MPKKARQHKPAFMKGMPAKRKEKDQPSRQDGSGRRYYFTARWKRLRNAALERCNHLCEECKRKGILRKARVVDHIEPHDGDVLKFFDYENLQGMCQSCHSSKTCSEDGGFGHKKRRKGNENG